MNCSLLYALPLTVTSALFILACATVGGVIVWLWFQWRYRIGIHYQRRQDDIDETFK